MARRAQNSDHDEVEEAIETAPHPLEELIRQRPLEAVIASVLVGVLLGRLFL
jgi:ElaB/YqjD/DUF883 family membrane-anchored ribosome-binding protein